MKEFNFYSAYPFKKPLLTGKQKLNRLKWAEDNFSRDWTLVIFSDECTIIKNSLKKNLWIGPETTKIRRVVKHEIKRNIYACISIGGLVTYDIFKENMNSDKYIEILEDKFIDIYKNNNNYVYQQDNSPIHKSNKTSEYFKKNNVTLMNWPAIID